MQIERLRSFTGPTSDIACVHLSPDADLVYLGGSFDGIHVWRTEDGSPIGHCAGTAAFAVSPNGRLLATAVTDIDSRHFRSTDLFSLALYDAQTLETITLQLLPPLPLRALVFSPVEPLLAVCSHPCLQLIDVVSRAVIGEFPAGDIYGTHHARFSADGSRLAVSGGPRVRIWDVPSGALLGEIREENDGLVVSPDGNLVATSSGWTGYCPTAALWDAGTGAPIRTLDDDSGVLSLAFTPQGDYLIGAGYSYEEPQGGILQVWRTDTWTTVSLRRGFPDTIWSLDISQDGTLLATSSSSGTGLAEATLWRLQPDEKG